MIFFFAFHSQQAASMLFFLRLQLHCMGSFSSRAMPGWEWRFFVPMPLPAGELPLAGKREDLYFPAGAGFWGDVISYKHLLYQIFGILTKQGGKALHCDSIHTLVTPAYTTRFTEPVAGLKFSCQLSLLADRRCTGIEIA